MTEKIKNHSVYVAVINKGEVSYKHIPLLDVEIEKGKTLGAYLEQNEKEKQELKKELKELKEQLRDTALVIDKLKSATVESFRDVVDEMNKEKFL